MCLGAVAFYKKNVQRKVLVFLFNLNTKSYMESNVGDKHHLKLGYLTYFIIESNNYLLLKVLEFQFNFNGEILHSLELE